MSAKRTVNKTKFTPEQRAEHRRIRELFADWHPSPEELERFQHWCSVSP